MNSYTFILTSKIGQKMLEGIFAIMCSIYKSLARMYDLVLNIASTKIDFTESISSITGTIYVLMGIFMLFRITVSFLNMLVDPDKVNDKSAGVSSIIIRTFVAIVLLIALKPGSFAFNFMDRLESAVLEPDGLLGNFIGSLSYDSIDIEEDNTESGVYNCYFFEYTDGVDSAKVFDAHHFKLSSNRSYLGGSATKVEGTNYYIEFLTDSITSGGKTLNFSPYNVTVSGEGVFNGCPTYFAQSGLNNYDFSIRHNKKIGLYSYNFEVSSSETEFMIDLGKYSTKHEKAKYYNSEVEDFTSAATTYYSEYNDTNASDGSLSFARGILKSFITSNGENINEITEKLLLNSAGDKEVFEAYVDDKIDIDMFLALIVGLAIVIYFIFICVDVIIRSLKLMLLQIIAPIAVISYIDPKDKIFNSWGKMYLSTYADIFIKLFAIGIVVNLLDVVLGANTKGFTLFYIIALLIFIKAIPSMINKIFGIEVTAGSFKDVFNIAKKGVTTATGAVIGGFVGATTGKGLGMVSGFARGALQGAGSGYKGDVLGGAHKVSAKNFRINDAKANGLGFFRRTAAEMAGTLGFSPKTKLDNKIKEKVDNQKMLDDWRKQKDNVEAMAEKNNVISDLNTKLANGEIGKEEYKKIRERYIKWMTDKDDNGNYIANKNGKFNVGSYKNLNTGEIVDGGQIEYKAGDAGKVRQAMSVLQTTYNAKSALRKELRVKDENGRLVEAEMKTYQDYLDSEDRATQLRNLYERQITNVQQSDEYTRAVAFDEYSKKS